MNVAFLKPPIGGILGLEMLTFVEPLEFAADFVPDLQLADVPPETRGLAELCLVLFNANEFSYVY